MISSVQLPLPLTETRDGDPLASFDHLTAEPAPTERLLIRDEYDELRTATASEIIAAARRAMTRRVRRGTAMDSPRAVREFLTVKLGHLEHELFAVLLLDTRHRLIEYVELFRGTIDGASVHPREVVKLALARNAAALVLAHPHPLCFVWGVTTPVISAENHPIRRSRKNGMGFCPVSSDRITPVSPSRRLRCSRALARSSTRRVAVRPACDGCAAA
jgi:hypothetical protein